MILRLPQLTFASVTAAQSFPTRGDNLAGRPGGVRRTTCPPSTGNLRFPATPSGGHYPADCPHRPHDLKIDMVDGKQRVEFVQKCVFKPRMYFTIS